MGRALREAEWSGQRPRDAADSEAAWSRRTVIWIGAATALRLVIAAGLGLTDTEAYYAQWGRHLALSYYDHPPLVAWTSWLVCRFDHAAWADRLVPVACSVAFAALLYRLTARLFSPRAAFLAVVLSTATPAFFLIGVLINPEALLGPLWVLFLLLLLSLRDHDEAWRPLALGAVVGVGFLAKYTAVLAVPVTLLYLAESARTRRWLRRPELYLGGLVALAITTPVIVWNAARGWPSLRLHLVERLGHAPPESVGAVVDRLVTGQVELFHPLLLPAMLIMLVVAMRRASRDERYRFLSTVSAPVLFFLLAVMARAADSEPHWTMTAYTPLLAGLGGWLDESDGRAVHLARAYVGVAVATSAVFIAAALWHASSPTLARSLAGYDPSTDAFNETLGWSQVRAAVRAEAASLGPDTVVAAAHNVLCGHLEAALDDAPAVYCPSRRRSEFDFVGRRDPPVRVPVVFVDSARYPAEIGEALPERECMPVRDVVITRKGMWVGTYHLHACRPSLGSVAARPRARR